MKAFICLFTTIFSYSSNFHFAATRIKNELSVRQSNKNWAELLPESLYTYMYKSYGKFKTALLALDFQLTSNNIIPDEMSGSGQFRTATYSNNFLNGGQKIIITSRIPVDKNQIEKITSISSHSNCDIGNAPTNGVGTSDEAVSIWVTSHEAILINYGFTLIDKDNEDGFTHLYKGKQVVGNYIECRFGCGDGEFTMEFYNSEDD